MKIATLTTLLLLCLSTLPSLAQNKDSVAIRRYYEENAILWLGNYKYSKNNQSYPVKNLKEEFKFSRDASAEFVQYRKNNGATITLIAVSGGLLVSAILAKDNRLKAGLLAGSVLSATISIPISFKAVKQLNRSVWFYNRDILLR